MLRWDRGAAFLFLAKKAPQKIEEVWRVSYRRCEIRRNKDRYDGSEWGSGRWRTSRDRITGMDGECYRDWCGNTPLLQGTRGRAGMLCIRDVAFRGSESGAARVENSIKSYII